MIDYRTDGSHFLELEHVVQVDARTRVITVFQILSGRKHSVVVMRKTSGAWFVNGRKLAEVFLQQMRAGDVVYEQSLGAFLSSRMSDESLVRKFSEIRADVVKAPEQEIPLGVHTAPRAVYEVTKGRRFEGILFSHETFKGDALTPPAKFRCSRGHDNPDPDHGRCRRCPGKIASIV